MSVVSNPGLPGGGIVDPSIVGGSVASTSLGALNAVTPTVNRRVLDVSITGTFVGTFEVQRQMGSSWRTVQSYTAPAQVTIENAKRRPMRVICTAYTSGAAVVDVG